MKKLLLLLSIGLIPAKANTNTNRNGFDHQVLHSINSQNTLKSIGKVNTSGSNLNVRSSANTSSKVLTKLSNNSYIEIHGESGSFYKVKYGASSFGYASKSYLKVITSSLKEVTASALNVRSGGSTYYTKIGSLSKGTKVGVISTSNNWSRIVFDGNKTGYVSSEYLKSSQSYKYQSINISLTEYKQYDSRWAYKYLGNSKATFKSSGCTTTALAMLESKRLGKDVDPYTYSKSQKYTSGGAIYWPSTYNVITSSTNYLEKIYNILKTGKPVAIGLKKSSGSQHYVVIKGYKESNTLSKANFIISDPGSSTRKTLADVMATYPNFYKYIYAK